jgi:PAS domain S-box-containing protein
MAVHPLLHINSDNKTDSIPGYPLKTISDIATNGFFTVDHNWTVKYWNKAAEKLLGVPSRDIVGKNLWEKFAGTIPLEFYKVYHKAFLHDVPVHFQEYWGEIGTWFEVITYYCDNTLSVSFKTSKQPMLPKDSENKLKILNELYRYVTEITNDCLWEWDLQARELFWIDGGHKRVFGYQIENALIPQSFWESRLHPDDKGRVLEKLNKITTGGSARVWEDEYRFQRAGGEYAYVHDRGHIIYEEGGRAARMIGATQDITEKVLLEKKLVQERLARQREITGAVLTAQENERADIGKELQNNLGQILALTKMYMQMVKSYENTGDVYLKKSCEFLINVIDEVRRISKNLAPPGSIIGLGDSIRNLLEDMTLMHPLKIDFYGDGINEAELNEKLQLTVFRVVQEQMNNIIKHANATRATIHLGRQEDQLVLLITDNGVGYDLSEEKPGVGIINIKTRVELYHGKVTIASKPGEGYKLKVELPLNKAS